MSKDRGRHRFGRLIRPESFSFFISRENRFFTDFFENFAVLLRAA
jgi:hypothetical protein